MEEAHRDLGITVLAMRTKDGKLLANPPDEQPINGGDRLIVIGTKTKLTKLEKVLEEGEGG